MLVEKKYLSHFVVYFLDHNKEWIKVRSQYTFPNALREQQTLEYKEGVASYIQPVYNVYYEHILDEDV